MRFYGATMAVLPQPRAEAPHFRLWPPVAVYGPLAAGVSVTWVAGDPVGLPAWRVPVGWLLLTAFVVWNGWCLALFARRRTGLLPGQETTGLLLSGPFAISRNPLYLGLAVSYVAAALIIPSVWALLLRPLAVIGLHWGAVLPEERYLTARLGEPYVEYTRRVRRWL